MKALKYVSGLLPQFGKDRLQEDIRVLKAELFTVTIPSYKQAVPVMAVTQSPKVAQMQGTFRTVKGADKSKPLVAAILQKLEELKPVVDYIERIVEDDFEVDVIVAGITLQKATILRMLELTTFISTFSLRLLNYIYILESEARGTPGYTANNTNPREMKLLESHIFDFSLALHALARPEAQIDRTLKSVPDLLVNERGQAALAAVTTDDPLQIFQVQGFTYNPIYHIGLMVATWSGERYKRSKDLKSVLELRLLRLKRAKEDSQDPGLDREIEVVQSRIDRLTDSLNKVEESVK